MSRLVFLLLLFVSSLIYADVTEEKSFSSILEKRHSGYTFDKNRSIPKAKLIEIAEAARLSPSSYNEQPWRFIFCDQKQTPEGYKKVFDSLVDANQKWAKNAPVLVVVLANLKSTRNQENNSWALYDTGAASMSLVLKATSLDLMAHEMGGFNSAQIKKEFNIPNNFEPISVIALGYEQKTDDCVKITKNRLPLNDNFFYGNWAKGITP